MELGKIILIVLIAEVPCMLRAFALQVKAGDASKVVAGTLVGTMVALVIGVVLAEWIRGWEAAKHLNVIAGVLIVLVGIWLIFDK